MENEVNLGHLMQTIFAPDSDKYPEPTADDRAKWLEANADRVVFVPSAHSNGGNTMDCTKEQIENWFTYHAPKGDQPERYVKIRDKAKELALCIAECAPDGADRAAAFRKLREAVMTANAAIACGE